MTFTHLYRVGTKLVRYWLPSTVLGFALLLAYTSHPLFGAAPVPTPDVQTVPQPVDVATPTNTPFPTATPVEPDIPQVPTPLPTIEIATPDDHPSQGNSDHGSDPGDSGNSSDTTADQPASDQTSDTQTTSNQPSVQTPAQTNDVPTGSVSVAVLNLRKAPNTSAAIIDTLFHNDLVQILGRNTDGSWWFVCCGADTKKQGWVTAQLVRTNLALAKLNLQLPVLAGSSAAPALASPAKAPMTGTLTVTTTAPLTATSPLTTSKGVTLQLQMRPSPAFVWQGQEVNVQFVVKNVGAATAVNVRLRDDLTTTLRYLKATISDNGHFQQQAKTQGGSILNIGWPQLAAGASVTATVTLHVAPDIEDGSLIDNLAVVAADNTGDVSAGLTLAMPPTLMPQFK